MNDLISRQSAIHAITNYNGVVDKSVAKRILIQMPSAQPDVPDTNVGDMISRRVAIDAVWNGMCIFYDCDVIRNLKALPSAQPEIVRCKNCKHHHYDSKGIPYCDRIDYGYGWKDDDFCSKAERRADE